MDKHSIAAYLEYVGAAVPARGHGWRKIKCPFHGDKHASAGVNFDEGRFKCHGCGVGGDVYDLIMYREGGNYREAVKFAETISPTGNDRIRSTHTQSRRLSGNTGAVGRRSKEVSFRSSGQSITRSRRLQG
jgi:DNA primase